MMTMMMMMMMAFFPEKVSIHRMRGARVQSFLRSRCYSKKNVVDVARTRK